MRRQGAPTRVISRDRAVRFVQTVAAPSELLRYSGDTYRTNEVEETLLCDAETAKLLGVAVGSQWYHIGGARRERGTHQVVSCMADKS